MNRAKICHLTIHPPFDQRVFHRTCHSLAQAGYDTHLLVQLNEPELKVEGVNLHSIEKFESIRMGLQIRRRLKRLWRSACIAQSLKADIYHLHAIELILLGFWLKLTTHAHVIYDSHEDNISYLRQKYYIPRPIRWLLLIVLFLLEWVAAHWFDAIITADQGVANIYRQRYKAKWVVILHNFPRLDLFADGDMTIPIEKRYDLVYHGTIPRYHLEVAFSVAQKLRDRGIRARWLFFGDCVEIDWARAELEKYNLTDCFEIDPKRIPHQEVSARVRQAKIGFIPLPDLPKFQHNIPTKLFEYMALEMPAVLSDLPPSRPFVGDELCAIMVPPHDYDAYVAAIDRLLQDDALRTCMGHIGRQRVLERYNWEAESQKLLDLYQVVLNGNKRGG